MQNKYRTYKKKQKKIINKINANSIKTNNKMYKKPKLTATCLRRNLRDVGETIEQKVTRIMTTKEPITDGAPLIFTDRKEGIIPDYDIRTDKMEYAVEAMDNGAKAQLAKRTELLKPPVEPTPGESTENAPQAQP